MQLTAGSNTTITDRPTYKKEGLLSGIVNPDLLRVVENTVNVHVPPENMQKTV